ncbi:BrnA antitoxin family protein [Thiospirillum jenense]|uniref:BrnA antitoxin family protein n=1 Tax=Thiospirillum jenense TaxID=1653858 RepID=A0A839HEW5_9GAMM|nr:BrnA antitoxin family protein [Thiospirillum jenense]MBB1127014.1 BrnA antitoxin family protein [Thiospirillum jenense]
MKPISTIEMPMLSNETDDDAPALTQTDFDCATFRVNGKVVGREVWQTAVCTQIGKHPVSLLLDDEIIAFFKAQAEREGEDYQSYINAVLYHAMQRLKTTHSNQPY